MSLQRPNICNTFCLIELTSSFPLVSRSFEAHNYPRTERIFLFICTLLNRWRAAGACCAFRVGMTSGNFPFPHPFVCGIRSHFLQQNSNFPTTQGQVQGGGGLACGCLLAFGFCLCCRKLMGGSIGSQRGVGICSNPRLMQRSNPRLVPGNTRADKAEWNDAKLG